MQFFLVNFVRKFLPLMLVIQCNNNCAYEFTMTNINYLHDVQ